MTLAFYRDLTIGPEERVLKEFVSLNFEDEAGGNFTSSQWLLDLVLQL